ncbi:COG1470 family protein [Streptomyces lydicus]|uniref:COG1470 family protein n=1 Tax=Streptomyces lydicus TaxID=47763 RepID=UPI0036FEE1EF
MPFRPRTALRGAALAAAAGLLCPAPAAAAPAGPGWSAAPAPAAGAAPGPQDRPYFYLEGAPGTVMTDRLSLGNPTGRAVTVRLRATGTGSWLALAAREVKVPARTRAGVPFTVTVPRDAAPGEHPGTLVATGGGRRAAVPVHLRVTGPRLSALTVENVSVSGQGSAAVIRYTLVNRGNTVLGPRLALRADGVFGPVLRRPAHPLPSLLRPGRRVELTESWPDPSALDAVAVRLTVTAQGGAYASATASYTPVAWGALAGAALVLVAGAGGLVAVRRRRRAPVKGGTAKGEPGGRATGEPAPCAEEAQGAGQLAGSASGARA